MTSQVAVQHYNNCAIVPATENIVQNCSLCSVLEMRNKQNYETQPHITGDNVTYLCTCL